MRIDQLPRVTKAGIVAENREELIMDVTRRDLFKTAGGVSLATMLGQIGASGEAFAAPSLSLPAKGEFPGVRDQVFLNCASDHPWPRGAAAALKDYGSGKMGLPGGGAAASSLFARLINAAANEITYVPSTSIGEYLVNQALGIPGSGGRIVTDNLHFVGSFYMYEQFAKQGMDVVAVQADWANEGRISVADFDAAITPGTKLVAISHVSMVNGLEHEVKAICDIAHARGALVFVDLIQSAGAVPVDVKAMGVDFAACGTYKWLMGDFGFAFLYVNPSLLPRLRRPWYGYLQTRGFVDPTTPPFNEKPYQSQQNNTVAGYFAGSFPARAVEAACAYTLQWLLDVGVANIQSYRQPMIDALQREMRARGWSPMTPLESRSPIVSFGYRGASQLAPRLAPKKIHITLRTDYFRVSPSVFNDMNDIDVFLGAIGNP
ncbi:MAG TPA: aminotransferase class V-fold PLP-dependent enzyme [Burkholderiales bacterium]|nr:aminotransferase class V-fold PLP-dependent enzyme [Burkholderiales bacterium]